MSPDVSRGYIEPELEEADEEGGEGRTEGVSLAGRPR